MDFNEFNHLSHIIIGSLAFIGGIVALATKKGSRTHKISGRVFALSMLYAVITTIAFMFEEFLPLAMVLSGATVYLLISSITALRSKRKYSRTIDIVIVIIPILFFAFTSMHFIRILPEVSIGTLARLLFSITFGILIYQDIKCIRSRPTDHLYFIKRHSFRMILAFGFAIMAVLRIGVKVDFLGLGSTTFFPLLLSLIAAFYVQRNINRFLIYRNESGNDLWIEPVDSATAIK